MKVREADVGIELKDGVDGNGDAGIGDICRWMQGWWANAQRVEGGGECGMKDSAGRRESGRSRSRGPGNWPGGKHAPG